MLDRLVGDLYSSSVVTRYKENPILTSKDIPYTEGIIYNGGVIKYEGRYVMMVRVDHADLAAQKMKGTTDIALAFSDDGISWQIRPQPCIAWKDDHIIAASDPRLMLVEGRCYVTVAVQTRNGMTTHCLRTEDFEHFDRVFTTTPDNRDIVLFPERVGGRYLRIERPFSLFAHGGSVFDMWISDSPDLGYWGNPEVLLDVERVPYANDRVGAGTPPIRTERGWLVLFHAVDDDPKRGKNGWEEEWTKRYTAGVMLLDLDDPRRLIGISRAPFLVPEYPYEISGGYRNNVVFPTGWVQEDTGEVKIYYGAADTSQCLASAHIDDLLGLCELLSTE